MPPSPVAVVAEYIRAEQELGRIRRDVDATEAAAVVVSMPFAAGMERALSTHPTATGEFPVPDDFPTPGGRRSRHPRAGSGSRRRRRGVAPAGLTRTGASPAGRLTRGGAG